LIQRLRHQQRQRTCGADLAPVGEVVSEIIPTRVRRNLRGSGEYFQVL
jgi:hypothetical protein